MNDERVVEREIPAAALEPGPGVLYRGANLLLRVADLKNCDNTIDHLLSAHLEGCGNVDLMFIEINYVLSTSGQSIAFGMQESGGSRSTSDLALAAGWYASYNQLRDNVLIKKELVAEGYMSRQIRPASSQRPMLKFCLETKGDPKVNVTFGLLVHGARVQYISLKA